MSNGEPVEPSAATAYLARDLLGGVALAEPFLRDWPVLATPRAIPPQALPVLSWLSDARRCAAPSTQALVDTLVSSAGALTWRQTYTAQDFGPDFLDRYGWTELVGQRGPIPSAAIACGILMLAPDTDYPAHSHEAEELYLPLAGTALWKRGDGDYEICSPATPIHHPAWMPHAMRTRREPLLALYLWRGGDLAAKSRIVGRDGPLPVP